MSRVAPYAMFLALMAGSPPAMAADDLARLFFTPEQRSELDARRRAREPDKPNAIVVSPTVRLDGYVKRSGGKSTVWVNGETVDSPARLPGSSEARVAVSDGGRVIRLKPGETLDRGNGEVTDLIGEGRIQVRRK